MAKGENAYQGPFLDPREFCPASLGGDFVDDQHYIDACYAVNRAGTRIDHLLMMFRTPGQDPPQDVWVARSWFVNGASQQNWRQTHLGGHASTMNFWDHPPSNSTRIAVDSIGAWAKGSVENKHAAKIAAWEAEHGRPMTDKEKKKRGWL